MNYEFAKELRDAGFPNIQDVQHRQGREFLAPDGRVSVYSLGEMAPTADWFIPTLEELMEACGDKLMSLHRTVPPRDMGNFWRAEAYFELESDEATPTRGSGSIGIGNTPTEAESAYGWHSTRHRKDSSSHLSHPTLRREGL